MELILKLWWYFGAILSTASLFAYSAVHFYLSFIDSICASLLSTSLIDVGLPDAQDGAPWKWAVSMRYRGHVAIDEDAGELLGAIWRSFWI